MAAKAKAMEEEEANLERGQDAPWRCVWVWLPRPLPRSFFKHQTPLCGATVAASLATVANDHRQFWP